MGDRRRRASPSIVAALIARHRREPMSLGRCERAIVLAIGRGGRTGPMPMTWSSAPAGGPGAQRRSRTGQRHGRAPSREPPGRQPPASGCRSKPPEEWSRAAATDERGWSAANGRAHTYRPLVVYIACVQPTHARQLGSRRWTDERSGPPAGTSAARRPPPGGWLAEQDAGGWLAQRPHGNRTAGAGTESRAAGPTIGHGAWGAAESCRLRQRRGRHVRPSRAHGVQQQATGSETEDQAEQREQGVAIGHDGEQSLGVGTRRRHWWR